MGAILEEVCAPGVGGESPGRTSFSHPGCHCQGTLQVTPGTQFSKLLIDVLLNFTGFGADFADNDHILAWWRI